MFLFFALLSLAAVLKAHKSHFSPVSLFFCGVFLALAVTHRISALAFCGLASLWIVACLFKKLKKDRKAVIIHTSFLALGILTIFIPASMINIYLTKGDTFSPVPLPYMSYISHIADTAKPVSMNTAPKKTQKSNVIVNMLRKTPAVFSASETPNNINYYFLKYKLFPLQYLVGPLLLIPLAVTALILLLFNRGILHKESILFVFIFSYMLSIIIFIPLARYRLVLIPVFCMLAPYPLFTAWKAWHNKKLLLALTPIILWSILLYINLPVNEFLRSTDFVSYGKGIQFKTGKSTAALPYFQEAYKIAPYKQMTVINLADTLLKTRRPKEAIRVLLSAFQKSPKNIAYRYYLGIAYFFNGNPGQTEKIFSKIDPNKMGDLKDKYYFFYEQSLRAQKKHEAAAKLRQKALKDSNAK